MYTVATVFKLTKIPIQKLLEPNGHMTVTQLYKLAAALLLYKIIFITNIWAQHRHYIGTKIGDF